MEEHSEWDFAKHFSKFNKKKAPIGSRVQEGDALLSDTEAIMSPKKPVVSAVGISAGTGGVQSIVQLDAKVDKVLEAVNNMQARVLSLALAHSLSHVQTMAHNDALYESDHPIPARSSADNLAVSNPYTRQDQDPQTYELREAHALPTPSGPHSAFEAYGEGPSSVSVAGGAATATFSCIGHSGCARQRQRRSLIRKRMKRA